MIINQAMVLCFHSVILEANKKITIVQALAAKNGAASTYTKFINWFL